MWWCKSDWSSCGREWVWLWCRLELECLWLLRPEGEEDLPFSFLEVWGEWLLRRWEVLLVLLVLLVWLFIEESLPLMLAVSLPPLVSWDFDVDSLGFFLLDPC